MESDSGCSIDFYITLTITPEKPLSFAPNLAGALIGLKTDFDVTDEQGSVRKPDYREIELLADQWSLPVLSSVEEGAPWSAASDSTA